jgi:hypothetical protein
VLWKQERFMVLSSIPIGFFRILLDVDSRIVWSVLLDLPAQYPTYPGDLPPFLCFLPQPKQLL